MRSKSLIGLLMVFSASPLRAAGPRINAPHFNGDVAFEQAGLSWLGSISPTSNYADIRAGYNDQELWINLEIFDRLLWQDDAATRTAGSLETWDAATVLINLDGSVGQSPSARSSRFVGELYGWRGPDTYKASYFGNGSAWVLQPSSFSISTGWRGDAMNNTVDDRGWVITFHIPFASLGLSGPPAKGTIWGLGVIVHDRDTADGSPAIPNTNWPVSLNRDQPSTWGQIAFGLPVYVAPSATPAETIVVRHKLNNAVVQDVEAGGSSTCGNGLDYWTQWGNQNYAGGTTLVVQNEADVSDWPCYSKIYFNFPLNALPANRVVLSATLKVYQFGGSDPTQAKPSLIQALDVRDAWSENTLTWNNAPIPYENFSSTWVNVMTDPLVWPGVPHEWDVSLAVAEAYALGQPVNLALYSGDSDYHSGKYFTSSETGDWNEVGRPTLTIRLGYAASATAPQPPQNLRFR